MSKKLQEAVAVKEAPKKKKSNKWAVADAFLAIVSLAILNAALVYAVLITLQFSRGVELAISGMLVLVFNLHIVKRLF